MPGLEDLYREIILDHYRTPRNRGELPTPPAVVAQGHNPLCGDEITVYLQVDGDVVDDVKVGGQGCSISQSSASMMSPGDQGPHGRRGARARPPVQGDDVDRGRRRPTTATATATAPTRRSATSRRCRAWSSSRCASSAPRWPGTRCSTPSTSRAGLSPSRGRRRGPSAASGGRSAISATPSSATMRRRSCSTSHRDARRADGPARTRVSRAIGRWCAPRGVEARRRRGTAAGRATTTGRSPGGRARGASTSRCTATATRSKPRARCGAAHEGAPGRSHGGVVAGLFDDVFGFVLDVVQEPAFTGELTIRYVAADAAAPADRLPGPAGRPRGSQAGSRASWSTSTTDGEPVVARGRARSSSPSTPRLRRADRQAPRPAGRGLSGSNPSSGPRRPSERFSA